MGDTAPEMRRTCSIISASIDRRPAVSTMTTSRPSRLASSTPWNAVSTGSSGSEYTGTSTCRPSVRSCSTAAGRWRSAPTSSGLRPCDLNHSASLPVAVVLPEPCRPAMRMTVGGFGAYWIFSVSPPRMRISSSWTALTTCWPGSSACERVAPIACSRMRLHDRADDGDVDVGLEERGADLLHDLVDVGLGEATLAAEALDDPVEAVGEVVEHASAQATCRSTGSLGAAVATRWRSADVQDRGARWRCRPRPSTATFTRPVLKSIVTGCDTPAISVTRTVAPSASASAVNSASVLPTDGSSGTVSNSGRLAGDRLGRHGLGLGVAARCSRPASARARARLGHRHLLDGHLHEELVGHGRRRRTSRRRHR